jgi:penicillin-binding protein 1C
VKRPSARLTRAALAVAAAGATSVVAALAWIAWRLPDDIVAHDPAPSVVLEDRSGVVLRSTRAADGSRTRWVRLSEMDPDLLRAFVAVEDRRFFEHRGVDLAAVARALRDNVRQRRVVSGASTITMQLARLVRPAGRDLFGKVTQALWALRLEAHLGKQEILEQYLNRLHLGQGAVGVGAASALYFGASASEVSIAQAALLAGLAHAPSSDNPFVSQRRARARRALALERMGRLGLIADAEAERARQEPVARTGSESVFRAPHFTTRVLLWAQETVDRPSGRWRTTLDLTLQEALEAEVRHTVAELGSRGARHGAAVVLDNRTGDILAWVGSPDFWADTSGQTDMVVSRRQPGSALKPFLYGLAFDRGHTPATVIADVARTYRTSTGPYRPRNYDHRFHGPVRAREALGSSYNIPAVELTARLGASSLLATLRLAGFASLGRSAEYYGLGLSLGNGDVTLLEMANAYRALANGGVWRPFRWRADAPAAGETRRVMSAHSAAMVLDILADPEARIPGFGVQTPFDFPFRAAVKTGTSRHFTDNWAVAATAGFTVAVWVGNFSGRAMEGVSGVSGAGPLLQRAVQLTARRYAPGALATPATLGARAVTICRLSGQRAGPYCPHALEWFAPGTEPTQECDWHRGERVVLPDEYAEWKEGQEGGGRREHLRAVEARSPEPPPASVRPPPSFRIVSPRAGDRYSVPPGVDARYATVALRATGGGSAVEWSVDGHRVADTRFRLRPGTHRIVARSAAGARDSVTVQVD